MPNGNAGSTTQEKTDEEAKDLDKDTVISVLEDALITRIEDQLTPEMIDELEAHEEEEGFVESYL